MNKHEIIDALNAVRTAGHEFTKAFNTLSDVIEAMAGENEKLELTLETAHQIISEKDAAIATMRKEIDSTYARAIKAEHDGWEVTQTLARTNNELAEVRDRYRVEKDCLVVAQAELSDLRPFRSTVDKLNLDLASREDTITSLRSEVSKLLEIILNVATSVDSVVNKPKDEPFSKTLYSDDGPGVKPMHSEPGIVVVGTSPANSPQTIVHDEPLSYPRAVGA